MLSAPTVHSFKSGLTGHGHCGSSHGGIAYCVSASKAEEADCAESAEVLELQDVQSLEQAGSSLE